MVIVTHCVSAIYLCSADKFSGTLNTHDTFEETIRDWWSKSQQYTVYNWMCPWSTIRWIGAGSEALHQGLTSYCGIFLKIIECHGFMPDSVSFFHKGRTLRVWIIIYRPIALATTLSKALEWCVLIQYSDHLITSDLQFGFKPGHSTTLAVYWCCMLRV